MIPRLSRRVITLLVMTALAVLSTAGAAAADLIPGGAVGTAACGLVISAPLCSGAQMAANLAPQGLQDAAGHVFGSFMPSDPVSDWAKSAGKSSAQALAQVQSSMIKAGQPHFLDSWWLTRYATTFGIGIVVMAGTLMFLAARLSSQGPEGYRMLRQSGLSASVYFPIMALAPAAVDIVVQMIYALVGWIAQQTTADSGTAVENYVRVLNDMGDPNNFALGSLGLLLFAGIAFVGAVLAMIENAIATFGAQLLMLMVPIIAAIAVYPPARKHLSRVGGIILGLLLTPVMLFLAYWTVWGAAAGMMTGHAPDPVMTMLFVAVGSLVAISAPAVLGLMAPAMASSLGGHHGASQRLRQQATNARRGVTSGARKIDQARRGGGSGAARGAALGGSTAGVGAAAQAAQKAGQTVQSGAKRAGAGRGGGQHSHGQSTGQSRSSSSTQSPSSTSPAATSTGGRGNGGQGSSTASTPHAGQSGHGGQSGQSGPSGQGGSGPTAPSRSANTGGAAQRGGTQRISGVLPLHSEPPAQNSSSSTGSSGSTGSGRSAQEGQT